MKIAICEDNPAQCDEISGYIQSYCARQCCFCEIHHFYSAEELLCDFKRGSFDILFLDIYLPGISGVEAAQKIRETDPDCAIIFITVSSDHALAGYAVQAVSYVVKPLDPEKMDKALSMCRHVLAKAGRYITVTSNYTTTTILVQEILYVEVFGKTVLFHLTTGQVKAYLPLDEVEDRLGGAPFLRCHRSFLVNMNRVKDVQETDFVLENGARVPIRKNGRMAIKMTYGRHVTAHPSAEGNRHEK